MNESHTVYAPSALWQAPAKLNLFLHLTGRIEVPPHHGYHALQTYFQLIDYGDRLQFELTDAPLLEVNWRSGDEGITQRPLRPEDDILHRAATRLKAHPAARDRTLPGVRITLHKNTPVGGGMGGGSSAAATALLALNHFWQLNLDASALRAIGLELGADVPVFLGGKSAWGEGIGEKLTTWASPTARCWFVIVVPQTTSWTHELFAHPDLPRDTPPQNPDQLLPQWQSSGFNAFEHILLENNPAIRACHEALQREAGFARVTGSGACLFTPTQDEAEALRIAEKIRTNTPEIKRVIIAPAIESSHTTCTGHENI